MKKKFILFIVSLAIFSGFSDNVLAQIGVLKPEYLPKAAAQQKVTPRRADATTIPVGEIKDGENVNNEFGAGESSKITPSVNGPIVSNPTPKPPFLIPDYSNSLLTTTTTPAGPVDDIQIGSEFSKNIVIRTYTGDGFAMGWISILDQAPEAGQSSADNFPDPVYGNNLPLTGASYDKPHTFGKDGKMYEFSFNKFNIGAYTAAAWAANAPPCGQNLFQTTSSPSVAHPGGTLVGVTTHIIQENASTYWGKNGIDDLGYVWVDAYPTPKPISIYTSTIDNTFDKIYLQGYYDDQKDTKLPFPIDDNIPLVQFNGLSMTSGLALAGQKPLVSDAGTPDGDLVSPDQPNISSKYLANYKRPTTILISGDTHRFTKFSIKDIEWNYEINQVEATPSTGIKLSNCNSGASAAYSFTVDWVNGSDYPTGQTLVDGAIVLMPDARVCVTGDVIDATTAPASKQTPDATGLASSSSPDTKTDAILALPDIESGRFTLRTGGNFEKLNMAHDDLSADKYYTQATFPQPNLSIFLYTAGIAHDFGYPLLTEYNGTLSSGTTTGIVAPPAQAEASIWGVYGDYIYTTNNADIHTTATGDPTVAGYVAGTTGTDDNRGVIEIGPTTAGKEHFFIYSGGILKNIECVAPQNFTMNFGDSYGKMPNLYLDGNVDLSILNYGNNGGSLCDAKILFHAGTKTMIANAFTNPDVPGAGALRVQALGNVEFLEEDLVFDNTGTKMGNNLYVLSDDGNIITEKQVNITSDYASPPNGIGIGLVAFWAEDKINDAVSNCLNNPANRFSARGNIYLKDNATIARTALSAGNTATNFIAANNIRTAGVDYKSESALYDTTNIISRKGDIYLGYSKDAADVFKYEITDVANKGVLNIKAGYDDTKTGPTLGGGNIYFTAIDAKMVTAGTYPTNIMIPLSLQYECTDQNQLYQRSDVAGSSMQDYEHSGIIGGLGRCGYDHAFTKYGGLVDKENAVNPGTVTAPSLTYKANDGYLLVDAGLQGNIIMNTGTVLDFQDNTTAGNAFFRTRKGDIDMRGITTVANLPLNKGVVFLADNGIADKTKIAWPTGCGCGEQSNNIYIQDFDFIAFNSSSNAGSLYFGADNNIKLQYGGLRDIGTWQDPFLSDNQGYGGKTYGLCYPKYHCDSNPDENQAGDMILNFEGKTGGVGIVASDQIDIYKNFEYYGGSTTGMAPVPPALTSPNDPYNSNLPNDGRLHGESVAGYGLFIKTQGNKNNWKAPNLVGGCGYSCNDGCGKAPIQQVARLTFHNNVIIHAESSKVHVSSPTVDVIGTMELDAQAASQIQIKTDSMILHQEFILDGAGTSFNTWSDMPREMPIIKLGYSRFTPPFSEIGTGCAQCYTHQKGTGSKARRTAVDTVYVQFKNNAQLPRLHTLVADHTVLAFGTDSLVDHAKGAPYMNATIFTDTFKIRNQVELWTNRNHDYDTHFELVSEPQMHSKDFPGIFTRHLHMEPIAPTCKGDNSSDLWLSSDVLDVIASSTFGGFGRVHADVYVEPAGNLAPGYTSLRKQGNCYEQKAGTLKMANAFLDHDANLFFSVGNLSGYDEQYADMIEVDKLTLFGSVNIFIEERCGEKYTPGCYPLIMYNSVEESSLNNLHLRTTTLNGTPLRLDFSVPGIVSLCVGEVARPYYTREVIVPTPPPGVLVYPPAGKHYVEIYDNFTFKLTFLNKEVFEVHTNRVVTATDTQEELVGTMNANGEYEYTIHDIKTQPVYIYIGPNTKGPVGNDGISKPAVWSYGSTLYIRVASEDVASIYSIAGMLVKRIDVPEGGITQPLAKGAYIVTLKDGSVHKVIVK